MMVSSYIVGLPCRRNVIAELEDLVLCGVLCPYAHDQGSSGPIAVLERKAFLFTS